MADPSDAVVHRVVAVATSAGLTIATGESLTAGLVSARIADVPGASAVLRGAVVAYATDLKASHLGVPEALLAARGAVDADVATAMAHGARNALRADLGVGTTGVAGPGPQDGVPAGTVFVAVAWPGGATARRLDVAGTRPAVRDAAAIAAVDLLDEVLGALSRA